MSFELYSDMFICTILVVLLNYYEKNVRSTRWYSFITKMSFNYDLNADFCQWVPGDPFHAVTSVKYFMHMRVNSSPTPIPALVCKKVTRRPLIANETLLMTYEKESNPFKFSNPTHEKFSIITAEPVLCTLIMKKSYHQCKEIEHLL